MAPNPNLAVRAPGDKAPVIRRQVPNFGPCGNVVRHARGHRRRPAYCECASFVGIEPLILPAADLADAFNRLARVANEIAFERYNDDFPVAAADSQLEPVFPRRERDRQRGAFNPMPINLAPLAIGSLLPKDDMFVLARGREDPSMHRMRPSHIPNQFFVVPTELGLEATGLHVPDPHCAIGRRRRQLPAEVVELRCVDGALVGGVQRGHALRHC
mmetsp:Transcript_8446/g.21699  ORF Transcript_8446/g.21699 Transcript_8446/m.21699 type:complete len:215 (-) Transcript_8446:139-783(-)